jgi:hypothetical protein
LTNHLERHFILAQSRNSCKESKNANEIRVGVRQLNEDTLNIAKMTSRGKADAHIEKSLSKSFKGQVRAVPLQEHSSFEPRFLLGKRRKDDYKSLKSWLMSESLSTSLFKRTLSQSYVPCEKKRRFPYKKNALLLADVTTGKWIQKRTKHETSKLVDPASDHILRSKIKPCTSKNLELLESLRMAHYMVYNFP